MIFLAIIGLYFLYECIQWIYRKSDGGIQAKDVRTIYDIADFLSQQGERLEPLKVAEVEKIQNDFGLILPLTYRQFLFTMGKGAGRYMLGSSVFYYDTGDIGIGAADLIEENELPPLPEDAFVFWMHQGYRFAFFRTSEGDDPPVYYYTEDDDNQKEYIKCTERLTDFFLIELKHSFPDDDFPVPTRLSKI